MLRASLIAVCVLLSACTSLSSSPAAKLKVGISNEQDVIAVLGKPVQIWKNDDGSRTFDYTKQPNGITSRFVTLSANGKVEKVENPLAPDRREKVTPGMTPSEVERLLGEPGMKEHVRYTTSEIWTWYAGDNNRQSGERFQVRYSNGTVTKVDTIWRIADDPCTELSCND